MPRSRVGAPLAAEGESEFDLAGIGRSGSVAPSTLHPIVGSHQGKSGGSMVKSPFHGCRLHLMPTAGAVTPPASAGHDTGVGVVVAGCAVVRSHSGVPNRRSSVPSLYRLVAPGAFCGPVVSLQWVPGPVMVERCGSLPFLLAVADPAILVGKLASVGVFHFVTGATPVVQTQVCPPTPF